MSPLPVNLEEESVRSPHRHLPSEVQHLLLAAGWADVEPLARLEGERLGVGQRVAHRPHERSPAAAASGVPGFGSRQASEPASTR